MNFHQVFIILFLIKCWIKFQLWDENFRIYNLFQRKMLHTDIDQGVNFRKLAKKYQNSKVGKMTFGALWLHSGPLCVVRRWHIVVNVLHCAWHNVVKSMITSMHWLNDIMPYTGKCVNDNMPCAPCSMRRFQTLQTARSRKWSHGPVTARKCHVTV